MSKSELIKHIVHFSYNVSKEFIYKSIMDYLNASGSMLDKDIKFKSTAGTLMRYRNHFGRDFIKDIVALEKKFKTVKSGMAQFEIVELDNHPFFIASQFHPEFTSRPLRPNPLFDHFVGASILNKNK